jgi:rubrerythrin
LKALGGIRSTRENLQEAVSGETHEFKEMYPEMIKHAQDEGFKAAERSMSYANEVEKIHADLYQKALDSLGQEVEVDYHVCSVCGYTVENEVPDKCPICGAPAKAFFQVD